MDKQLAVKLLNPFYRRLYFLQHLPGALFFGLSIDKLDEKISVVSVPYQWSTKNPFRSIYFAALSAAAELSTGLVAMVGSYGKNISMLVTGMEGGFTKKAVGRIDFTCDDVEKILESILMAETQSEGVTVKANTIGKNSDGVEVARFTFQWSFRKKK